MTGSERRAHRRQVNGLWAWTPEDPDWVVALAKRYGYEYIVAHDGDDARLKRFRALTRSAGLRLAVSRYIGRPHPDPQADADECAHAFRVAQADHVIVNAEREYEHATSPVSAGFVRAFRRQLSHADAWLSSYGLLTRFHGGLARRPWLEGGFGGMPQAYEGMNPALTPSACLRDWKAGGWPQSRLRITLQAFAEPHRVRPSRLRDSLREIPGVRCNAFRAGTALQAELDAMAEASL